MNTYSATPFGLPDTAPELARRFAVIMGGLATLIARRFLKMPHLSRFTVRLWNYLSRSVRRFHRALTATTKPQTKRARAARAARTDAGRLRPEPLPAGRGWIVRELGWEAAAYLGAMESLLAEVAARTTGAGLPQAARILRPVCRMLGIPATVVLKLLPPQVVVGERLAPDGAPAVVGDCEGVVKSG